MNFAQSQLRVSVFEKQVNSSFLGDVETRVPIGLKEAFPG
jgi:hypothetical protein